MSQSYNFPYIPIWLDEAGLTPHQFRVLANLCRRAGLKRRCFPSASRIASDCCLDPKTVWSAVNVLEQRGFIRREKGPRNSNVYIILYPTATLPNGTTQDGESPCETEEVSGCETDEHPPCETDQQSYRLAPHEGDKTKVHKEGNKRKGEQPRPAGAVTFPWNDWDSVETQLKERINERYADQFIQEQFAVIRGRKIRFVDQYTGKEWPDVLLSEFETAAVAAERSHAASQRGKSTFATETKPIRRASNPGRFDNAF